MRPGAENAEAVADRGGPASREGQAGTPDAARPAPANEHWLLWSWASAGCALAILAVVMLATPAGGAGHVPGRLLSSAVLAALVAGLFARRSRGVWSWWRYPMVVVPTEVMLVVAEGVAASS